MRGHWYLSATDIVHDPAVDIVQNSFREILATRIDAHGKHRAGCMKESQRLVGLFGHAGGLTSMTAKEHRQSSYSKEL